MEAGLKGCLKSSSASLCGASGIGMPPYFSDFLLPFVRGRTLMLLDVPLFSSYTLIGAKLATVSRLANALDYR